MLVLAPQLMQATVVVNFALNQKAIEEAYCVNKDKPELQCHGTCHLKQQLSEIAAPQNEPSENEPVKPFTLRISPFTPVVANQLPTTSLLEIEPANTANRKHNETCSGFLNLPYSPPKFSC